MKKIGKILISLLCIIITSVILASNNTVNNIGETIEKTISSKLENRASSGSYVTLNTKINNCPENPKKTIYDGITYDGIVYKGDTITRRN